MLSTDTKQLQSPDELIRADAVHKLRDQNPLTPQIITALTQMLHDPKEGVQIATIRAFAEPQFATIAVEATPGFLGLLNDPNKRFG